MTDTITVIDDPEILDQLERLNLDCLDDAPMEDLKRYRGTLAFVLFHVETLLDCREDAA